ncbi:hypothetical protein ABZ540_33735 [Nocardia xishanensis]|uniref:hypothetical protein n=1 Tax=Nocardia xishanensis TaxID=238964 RepID=UPI0033E6BBC6
MSARAWVERAIVPETNVPGVKTETELFAYLPDDRHGQGECWLRRVLGQRITLEQVQHRGVTVWRLNSAHLLRLVKAMADEYGSVKMRLEISKAVKCDSKCLGAKSDSVGDCVCKCGGEHHGGRNSHSDWYRAGRSTLIRNETSWIDQVIITAGQIQLPGAPEPTPDQSARPPQLRLVPPPSPQPVLPQPVPPQPTPVPAEPPAPRTVVPAADRFPDLGRAPADSVPPSHSVLDEVQAISPGRPRRPVVAVVAAVAASAAVLAAVLAVVVTPPHPDARPAETTQETVAPPPAPPALPDLTQEVVVPPIAAPPAPQFPPGCYPFQLGC